VLHEFIVAKRIGIATAVALSFYALSHLAFAETVHLRRILTDGPNAPSGLQDARPFVVAGVADVGGRGAVDSDAGRSRAVTLISSEIDAARACDAQRCAARPGKQEISGDGAA
jgi:hypothetical protein